MTNKLGRALAVVCVFAFSVFCGIPVSAQMQEVKEKPPMYTYVAFWTIPRQQWADEAKTVAAEQKLLDKGVADGQLVGYGDDSTLVHTVDGATHDTWFSSMSMAGLLNALDGVYKSGMPTGTVQSNATRHSDQIMMSHYYNWHPGTYKEVYSYALMFSLKPTAPNNAADTIAKSFFAPLLEKLLADGTIHEYEIDTEAVHTQAPGTFMVDYIAASAEALDKTHAALEDAIKSNPLGSQAIYELIDVSAHRDYLLRTNATYK
jgi:hypothetical protein